MLAARFCRNVKTCKVQHKTIRHQSTSAAGLNVASGTEKHLDHPIIASYVARKDTPMFKNQLQVPRLPIPALEDTCAKYLKTVEPLLTPEQFKYTQSVVKQFLEKDGPALHKQLQELDQRSPTSWLEGWWDTMYRELRCPTPINVNPFFIYNDQLNEKTQAERAAGLIHAAANFTIHLRNYDLEPDMERTKPLCMSQYDNLYATRIPHSIRDQLYRVPSQSRHIVIIHKDHYFTLDILDSSFQPIPASSLKNSLDEILKSSKNLPVGEGVGVLTTEERTLWSSLRNQLISSGNTNQQSIRAIDDALFAVCLDDIAPTVEEFSPIMLHNHNGRNRYFDKSLQVVVAQNGLSGVNMEHSGVDGHTVVRWSTDIYQNQNRSFSPAGQPQSNSPVRKLDFQLSSAHKQAIQDAEKKMAAFASSTHTKMAPFLDFGKNWIVSQKLSPDAFVQMAFQLAYYRQNQRLDSTYESAMTKGFLHGRTETVRSTTNEALNFVKTFSSSSASDAEKETALRQAVERHSKLMNECKNGQGIDRHLYGMYNLARHNQQALPAYEIPAIYQDSAYSKMGSSVLSTSHIGTPAFNVFGFGPVVQNGYGIAYFILDNKIPMNITTFERPLDQFVSLIAESLRDMKTLVTKNQK